ncbi:MAG: 16S rRNA (cytosine(967)-C(5))-methyltransferase RsmB [Clostridia bacterium]|nr:16S rRNA (cytosine(967)-C(5))-methyltransferase RsmB [Clostridia bacterium]
MANARKIAVDALIRVELDGAYSNLILGQLLSKSSASKEDKSLASAIFYGVLDRIITLDFYINKLSKIPSKKLQPYTRQVLRSAIYQIYYMDRVPNSAAVNEAVKLIKKSNENRNSGYVNAVLRNAADSVIPLPTGSDLFSLSVRYSCPQWILKDLVNDYGAQRAEEFLKAFLLPSRVNLRVNTLKISTDDLINKLSEQGVSSEKTDIDNCIELLSGIDFADNSLFADGFFHVQDLSSQQCAHSLSAIKGERILDLCAAPGGKSFTVAEIMEDSGEIISCDLYESRVSLITKGAERLGIKSISAKVNDATVYNKDLGLFDAVLCDVPCSGFGVIRRKPEIKYKPADDFSSLEAVQKSIIETSSKYVKKGGRMLYSTCTIRKAENEAIVNWFLDNNRDFSCEFMHTFYPSENNDGFFCALLVFNA